MFKALCWRGISRFLSSAGLALAAARRRRLLAGPAPAFPGWVSLRVGFPPRASPALPEPCYTPQKLPRALRTHTHAISQCQHDPCCDGGAARAASRDKSHRRNFKPRTVWAILIRHREPPRAARPCFHPQQLPAAPATSRPSPPLPSGSPSLEMPLTPSVVSLDCTPSCKGSPKAAERG